MKKIIILAAMSAFLFLATGSNSRANGKDSARFADHFETFDYTYENEDVEMTVFIQHGSGECFILGPYIENAIFAPKAFCDQVKKDMDVQ